MKVTKFYCDRCGKEVTSSVFAATPCPITVGLPKKAFRKKESYVAFRRIGTLQEFIYQVCFDCMDEFQDWWDSGRIKADDGVKHDA